MKTKSLASCRSLLSAAVASGSLVLLLAGVLPPAQACGSRWKELPRMQRTVFLLPTVANRMEHWDDKYDLTVGDSIFILLPENAKVNVSAAEGGARLAAYESLNPQQMATVGSIQMPLEQKGYKWWKLVAFASGEGSSTIAIDAAGKKTELKVAIRPYEPRYEAPVPRKMGAEKTTRDKPFTMTQGDTLEIVLPGELGDGWTVNSGKEAGMELKDIKKMPTAYGQPGQVKLTLDTRGYSGRDPVRLVIKRGGDNSESFEYYIMVWPAPKC